MGSLQWTYHIMLKILTVEDNMHKRQSLIKVISDIGVLSDEAYSFTSAWIKLQNNDYDLVLLDMSLPTFDKTDANTGGAFRVFGGKELARKMFRRNITTPFLFVTQYKNFSENKSTHSFDSLKNELLNNYHEQCKGFILYSNSNSDWKEEIERVIMGLSQ